MGKERPISEPSGSRGDLPSTDFLDEMMAQIIARMSVISEQRARSYEGVSVNGGERGHMPRLDEKPLIDYYRDRFARAAGYHTRRAVVVDALAALKLAQRRQPPASSDQPSFNDPQWKQWVADNPRGAAEIARLYGVSRQYVHQIQRAYGGGKAA